MTTLGAIRALKAAEQRTPQPVGSRYIAMRDLAFADATGNVLRVKRGEALSATVLNCPRVNVAKLLGVRQIREEFIA